MIWVALLAALIALIGHALFGWGPERPGFLPTPPALNFTAPEPPSGGQILLRLAAAATRRSASGPDPAQPYAYVKRSAWHLQAGAGAGTQGDAARLPTVTESWRGADGAGRVRTVTPAAHGPAVGDQTVSGGPPLPALPAREAALAAALQLGETSRVGPAQQFDAVATLTELRPIAPPVQAAILRLLASLPGLIDSGTVIDRAGRPGVAVSLDSTDQGAATRHTLIFDATTGALLEADQTVLEESTRLHVTQGSVIAYATILASGYAPDTRTRPGPL